MSSDTRPRLLVIDGHSMAFRAFFALPADKFVTTSGQPTNAVYGFISMLARLIQDERPTHVGVAFDAGHHTFRTERYPEYKAGRAATPPEFSGQVPLIQEVLAALNITSLVKAEIEADDILATLAHEGEQAGMDVLVCSGDRDVLQLVDADVTVLYPVKGVSDLARMTPQAVEDKYGVTPASYPDLAALVGEHADNLPGVPGVGPKTAAKWLNTYGSLGALLAAADAIPGKAAQSLREHEDNVLRNRELNRLLTDVDLPVSVGDLELTAWDRPALERIFDALQVRTLRERVLALAPILDPADTGESTSEAGSDFTIEPVASGALGQWLAQRSGVVGVAVSGRGRPVEADAWGLGVADAHGAATWIDLTGLDPDDDKALSRWLADPDVELSVHGAKAAAHALASRGIALDGLVFDPELAGYLVRPDRRGYDLVDLAEEYLGWSGPAAAQESSQGAFDLDEGGSDPGWGAAIARDAWLAAQLVEPLTSALERSGGMRLLTDLELPISGLLTRMESAGIAVDVPYLHELDADFGHAVAQAADAAYEIIGRKVNLSSPKQLQEVLFDDLQMPKTKRIKTGYTTDAAALADLYQRTEHPFLANLLAHRDALKLQQTVTGLLRSVADDGRIHTTFQQTVAATGRLSSTDPNLQNIPIRTDEGRRIRRAFIAGDGWETLVTADYSQIEMRIMAHLSNDAGLIEAFRSGEDLHRYVASLVYAVPASDVTSAMRSKIKAMSYGLAYGLSAYGLSKQLGIDVAEANDLMREYFERFGGVRDYLHHVVEDARATGYTETIMGRRRYLPDLTSDNRQRREMAERMALNAPIQGSAADLIKVAMLKVDARMRREGLRSRMLLQIHDELVVEAAPGEADALTRVLVEEMRNAAELRVPLDVSVGHGHDWQSAGH